MAKKEEKNIKDKTSFMKSFKAELKKVNWPTPKQLLNNTIAVLVIVVITAAIVFILDFAFESMNRYGLDRIKDVVSNSSVVEKTDDSNNKIDTDGVNESVENNSTVENSSTEIINAE